MDVESDDPNMLGKGQGNGQADVSKANDGQGCFLVDQLLVQIFHSGAVCNRTPWSVKVYSSPDSGHVA